MGALSDSIGADMELIFSSTLSSPASSITTGTLPTGYKSLVIDTSLRCDGSYPSRVVLGYFNGDTTKTNYQCTRFVMYSAAPIYGALDYPYVAGTTGATAPAGFFSSDRIVIQDHEGTINYKTWNTAETTHIGTGASDRYYVGIAGLWKSTAAITSITFEVDDAAAPDFIAGSFVAVYGLK
jgi:hypothetical protein